jgi:enamine deaminase RidA (YjgF/YER057c/UK114 family)
MKIQHVNPASLHRNPAFTQVITVTSASRLVFIGGQNGIDTSGLVVGDDLQSQTAQALRNVIAALQAVEANPSNVVRLGIYIVDGQDVRQAYAAAQAVWGAHRTAITVLVVSKLANPAFLVEIEATAACE